MKPRIPWNLIITKLERNITSEDNQKLMEWISDEKNLEIYNEIQTLWQKVQERTAGYIPDKDYYWKEIAKKLNLPSEQKKHYSIKNIYKYAACAVLLIACSISFYIGSEWYVNKTAEQQYTSLNGKSQIVLPDGSVVWLRPKTTLAYNTDFKKKSRIVRMRGEAYFEVAKDPDHQFVVHTDGVDITVHGTKFNVESIPGQNEISVSLLTGSVALSTITNPHSMFLVPGETGVYNKKSHHISVTKNDAAMDAAWATSSVQFTNNTLSDICAILSKRYDIHINVNPAIGKKYTYTFKLHDETIDEILDLMSSLHSFKYSYGKNGTINVIQ